VRYEDSQSASRLVLEDGTVITQCDECRTMWKERNDRGIKGEPECEGCQYDRSTAIHLLDGNLHVARVYQKVRNQVILYFNGECNKELDINHMAVWATIDHYPHKIENPYEVFELILSTYHYFLNERNAATI